MVATFRADAGAARPAPADTRSDHAETDADTTGASLRDTTGLAAPEFPPNGDPSLVHADDDIEGLPIGAIEIVSRNIFDPIPGGPLRGLYSLANHLHLQTRDHTVREQLLFQRGEPWRARKARETERYLRRLSYLYPTRLDARHSGDSVLVTVVTRDTWSTALEFNLESVGGKQYGSMAITESNLLGMGKSVSVMYRQEPHGIARSLGVNDPAVLGSRWRFAYSADKGSSGSADQFGLGVPFYAEETPHTYGVFWARRSSVARLYDNTNEVAQVAQRLDESRTYWGFGGRRNGVVRRMTFSFNTENRELGETRPLDAPPEFQGGIEKRVIHALETEVRIWRPRFIERVNVNQMGGIEDFDIGHSVIVRGGWAPEFLGSTFGEGLVGFVLNTGTKAGADFGFLQAGVQSRFRQDPREIMATLDGRWVSQSLPRQTCVLAVYGALGAHTDRTFQVLAGGLSGLRAYPIQAVAGHRLWRFNLEDRWIFGSGLMNAFNLALVGFTDVARGWGPGAEPSQWYKSAGIGFRMSLPRWSPDQVLRVDLAWPIDPARDGAHTPVLSFGSSQAF